MLTWADSEGRVHDVDIIHEPVPLRRYTAATVWSAIRRPSTLFGAAASVSDERGPVSNQGGLQ
eukprot:6350806-Prorocentrum_lima.AAC.1